MRRGNLSGMVAACVCAAAALAAAPPASATTVHQAAGGAGPTVFIADGAGVADDLRVVARTAGALVTVVSAASPIEAGLGCLQLNPRTVNCPADTTAIVAHLGPGADRLVHAPGTAGSDVPLLPAALNGGPGNDTIETFRGSTTVTGGAGNDTLATFGSSRNSVHTLSGGDGNDVIDLSRSSDRPDVASGGRGSDTVTYAARPAARGGVAADPDGRADDGRAWGGEHDNVGTDVENLTGTPSADDLAGTGARNRLSGGPGNDKLRGGAGSDTLLGGSGDDTERGDGGSDTLGAHPARLGVFRLAPSADSGVDTFDGGDGVDRIYSADGQADAQVACGDPDRDGPGGDSAALDLADRAPSGCERVQRAARDQFPVVRVLAIGRTRGGSLPVRLGCPRRAPGLRCRGTVSVLRGGRTLGRIRYDLRGGRTRTVRVPLRRRGRGRAQLRTRERDARNMPETTATGFRLR